MAQRTSQEVVDVGSRLPSGTARLDLSRAMLRDGSTPTSDREVPLSQGRTVLYATRPKTPARLIRATRSRALLSFDASDVCAFDGSLGAPPHLPAMLDGLKSQGHRCNTARDIQ